MDCYHAMEHVWACGRKLHGEGTETCTVWVKAIESLRWEGHIRAILEQLRADRTQARSSTRRKAISELITCHPVEKRIFSVWHRFSTGKNTGYKPVSHFFNALLSGESG